MGWLLFALIGVGCACVAALVYLVVRWDEEDRSEIMRHAPSDEGLKNDSRG